MTASQTLQDNVPSLKEYGQELIRQISGYIGTRVISLGIELDILDKLAEKSWNIEQLSDELDLDQTYLKIWMDAAYAYNLVTFEPDEENYHLHPHAKPLLVDPDHPSFIGGFPLLFNREELFDGFKTNIQTGERIWWDDTSPEWKETVGLATLPTYTRMIETGFSKIPGLEKILNLDAQFLELASGTGQGAMKLLEHYPDLNYTGLDGDIKSIQLHKDKIEEMNEEDRTELIHSTFEDLDIKDQFDVVFINASMHECRDLKLVTSNVYDSLKEGGVFVISDIPFPEDRSEYHLLPSKIMLGVNFYESQIDDTLLPTSKYVELLEWAGFVKVDSFNITPTQCVVFGYKQ